MEAAIKIRDGLKEFMSKNNKLLEYEKLVEQSK